MSRNEEMLQKKKITGTKTLVFAAMFLALGIVMPFLTGQIPGIGSRLLPMHIPVLICGYVCGWKYGMIVGFVTPILRSAMFGMPPMMPTASAMAFELAAYGAVTGLLYDGICRRFCGTLAIYISLIGAMMAGRLVWGLVSIPLYGLVGNSFAMSMFLAGAFFNAVPGIILQIVLIPVIIMSLRHANVME